MDNCRTHYNREFLDTVRATGALILPLSTYSPQYNPVRRPGGGDRGGSGCSPPLWCGAERPFFAASPQIESCFHVAKMWLRKNTEWVQHPAVTLFKALGAGLAPGNNTHRLWLSNTSFCC